MKPIVLKFLRSTKNYDVFVQTNGPLTVNGEPMNRLYLPKSDKVEVGEITFEEVTK